MNDELYEILSKHLIGRHEQSDHGPVNRQPNRAERGQSHRRVDHRTKAEKERNKARARRTGRAVGTATGLGLVPLAANTAHGMSEGKSLEWALAESLEPYQRFASSAGQGAKKAGRKVADVARNTKVRNLRRFGKMLPVEERIAKHLIGRHDQAEHQVRGIRVGDSKVKSPHARSQHRPKRAFRSTTPSRLDVAQQTVASDRGKWMSSVGAPKDMSYNDAREKFGKTDPTEFYAEFSKLDDDKKQVFGWASVVSKGGKTVVDRQMDTITPDDLETAAYSYVLKSRDGGEMHKKRGVATLVESFVVTPEKVAKLGLPEDSLPTGWWVGFQIKDDEVWEKVKKGHYTGFSIHGMGKRTKMEVDELFTNG